MTQYLLSIFHPEGGTPPPDELAQIMADVDAVNIEMQEAGARVFAGGLQPTTEARVVHAVAGESSVTDGPHAASDEPIGGFWIIEADDRDSAIEWAKKASAACRLAVEVRPFQDEPG